MLMYTENQLVRMAETVPAEVYIGIRLCLESGLAASEIKTIHKIDGIYHVTGKGGLLRGVVIADDLKLQLQSYIKDDGQYALPYGVKLTRAISYYSKRLFGWSMKVNVLRGMYIEKRLSQLAREGYSNSTSRKIVMFEMGEVAVGLNPIDLRPYSQRKEEFYKLIEEEKKAFSERMTNEVKMLKNKKIQKVREEELIAKQFKKIIAFTDDELNELAILTDGGLDSKERLSVFNDYTSEGGLVLNSRIFTSSTGSVQNSVSFH